MILDIVKGGRIVNKVVVPDTWTRKVRGDWKDESGADSVHVSSDLTHVGDTFISPTDVRRTIKWNDEVGPVEQEMNVLNMPAKVIPKDAIVNSLLERMKREVNSKLSLSELLDTLSSGDRSALEAKVAEVKTRYETVIAKVEALDSSEIDKLPALIEESRLEAS